MKSRFIPIVLGLGLLASHAGAATIALSNGKFSSNDTSGWTVTGTVNAGSGAAVMSPGATMYQDFSDGVVGTSSNNHFRLEFSFSVSANNPNQRFRIRDNNNLDDIITLRINAAGTGIECFSGNTWVSVLSGITIVPNTKYWLRVVGKDLNVAARSYTVGFSNDGRAFVMSSAKVGFHCAPVGCDFETIQFDSGANTTMTVDDVSVVFESSSVLLGSVCLLSLLRRRCD